MSTAATLTEALRRPPVLALLVAVLLAMLLWFVLPLIAIGEDRPFAGTSARLVAVLLVALGWGAANLLLARGGRPDEAARAEAARRREARLADRAARTAARAGLAAAGAAFAEADRLLRALPDRGRGLPWYLLVGPPRAGKTTLLARAGLPFRLQERLGALPPAEGPTAEAAIWIAERAVYLDTAGRLSAAAPGLADRLAWDGLLRVLRRRRPHQPLNGILLVVALDEVAAATPSERDAMARALRYRLADIEARFGFRPPCHLVFSRLDALPGFAEFVAGAGQAVRAAPLGADLPPAPRGSVSAELLAAGFDRVAATLAPALPALLQREPDGERRCRILEFPAQFAAQRAAVLGFLGTLVEPSRQVPPVFLRRFAFAAAPGDRRELDALSPALDAAFGVAPLPPAPQPPPHPARRLALFTQALLGEVLPAEAGLAGFDPRQARRERRGRAALALGSAVLAAGLGTALALGWVQDRARLAAAAAATDQAAAELERIAAGAAGDRLGILDALAAGAQDAAGADAVPLGAGATPAGLAAGPAAEAYRRGLAALLYPEIVAHLRGALARAVARGGDPAEVFAALRAYRTALGEGPFDAALLRAALRDWAPGGAAVRAAQARHLDALLGAGALPGRTPDVAPDAALVGQALARLRGWSAAELGYAVLRAQPAVQALPDWRIADHAGPAAPRALTRRSGRGLLDGVPGLYTAAGFQGVVLPMLPAAAREAAEAAWVLGEAPAGRTPPGQAPEVAGRVAEGILALYLDDYARAWEALLADVAILPFGTVEQTLDVLNALSTPRSPYRLFLLAAAQETTLVPPADAATAAQAAGGLAGAAAAAAGLAAAVPGRVVAAGPLARDLAGALPRARHPGQPVDDRFAPLHAFVRGANGQPADLDALTAAFRDLYDQLLQASVAPDSGRAMLAALQQGGGVALLRVEGMIQRLPGQVRRTVEPIVQRTQAVAQGTAAGQINAAWQARVLPLCRAVLERFPFAPTAAVDAGLADVTALFGPAGRLKGFFDEHLRAFVNTDGQPWARRRGAPEVSPAALAFLERAEALRQVLFPGGAELPRLRFELEPVELDERAVEVLLLVNGGSLSYRHGPPAARAFEWPGGASGARLTFGPPLPGGEVSSVAFPGPWGFHRLLARGARQPSARPGETLVRLRAGTRSVVFALRTGSLQDPFDPALFEGLRCPEAI